ncbi:(5-formylfuran-3-yl)methyl phosphate synthase [Pirellulaceae bacterium]|jgi:uncharacterized protein (UPF0264 family)|nr:(5-formylfuran-3-yl)methyl phosphate synthase [Pirellulaceae bacterium]
MQNKQLELLVSVRNFAEAQVAFDANVDIIDIKEPNHGSLGAASWAVIDAIATAFHQTPISAALGEIDECEVTLSQIDSTRLIDRGVLTYAKCGLANVTNTQPQTIDWRTRTRSVWSKISEFALPVAVAYADFEMAKCPPPLEILEQAIACNVTVLLIDTYFKNGTSSLDHLSDNTLVQITELAIKNRIKTVFAGSISESDLPRISKTNVNCVAVRGAVCAGNRTADISEKCLRDFQKAMYHFNKNRGIEIA